MNERTIVNKIRKLLALAQSSNENEAKAAIAKAQMLLAKHKLEFQDIESHEENMKVITKSTGVFYTKTKGTWKNTYGV